MCIHAHVGHAYKCVEKAYVGLRLALKLYVEMVVLKLAKHSNGFQ